MESDGGVEYYAVPEAWCAVCRQNVECETIAGQVGETRVVTFVCPTCGRALGVGMHGQTGWRPLILPRGRGSWRNWARKRGE